MAKPLLRLSPKKEALGDGVTYWMDVEKDQFLHFTTMSRARAILDNGGLMLNPPGIKKFGADGVYAISIVYGRSVPGTQRTHINPQHGPIVAVIFKTKTVPVVGFREEVRWDRDVDFTSADIVGPEVALALLNMAPESLQHSDDLVLYDDAHKPATPAARASKARVGASKGSAGRAGRSYGRSAPYRAVDFRTALPMWRMHYGDLVATREALERLLGPLARENTYWAVVDVTNSNKVFRIGLRDEREAPEASLWSLTAYGEAMADDVAVFTDWLAEGGVGLRPLSPAYSFAVGDLVAVHGKGYWRVEAIAHRQGRGAAAALVTVSSETLSGDFARVPAKAVRKIVKTKATKGLSSGSRPAASATPLVFYHGAQRWEGPPEIRPSKSKKVAVHGPGIYLTTHRGTASRYAKGGGTVMRMELSPDLRLLSDVELPVEEMIAFVRAVPRMRKKKEIESDLIRYATRVKRNVIPANVVLNLMNHYEVGYGEPGMELVRFYVQHGIDGDIVDHVMFSGMEEGEKWLVLFNTDKVLRYERSRS